MPKFSYTQTFEYSRQKGRSLKDMHISFGRMILSDLAEVCKDFNIVWEIADRTGYHLHGTLKIKSDNIVEFNELKIQHQIFGFNKVKEIKGNKKQSKEEAIDIWQKYVFKDWEEGQGTKRLLFGDRRCQDGFTCKTHAVYGEDIKKAFAKEKRKIKRKGRLIVVRE